ncbi:DNA cytosine methyltransferase [Streptomyces niveus]|uniref:DNA cytosine methyltransferase n=1 Tax=Streptomyces niveus TaxID=193462 RepID=UPI0036607BE8
MAVEALTGDKVTYVAEVDEAACKILAHHFPDAPNIGDITSFDWITLDGLVDIITAGFPCQDISNAGKREGIDGERSGIYRNVIEAIRILRPRLVFLENVAAIKSRGLWQVVADLAAIGYDVRWTCVRASAVGAAHHRDRWFAVAYPVGSVPDAESFGRAARGAEPEEQQGGVRRPSGARRELPADPHCGGLQVNGELEGGRDSIRRPHESDADRRGSAYPADSDSPRLEVGSVEPARDEQPALVGSGSRSEDPNGAARIERSCPAPEQTQEGGHGPTLDDEVSFLLPHADGVGRDGRSGDEPQSEGRGEPADGGYSPAEWWGDYLPAIRRWESLTGRSAPEPTETGPRGGRRLTARFAEWLMGLADGWVTGVPDLAPPKRDPRAKQLKAIGNGVVPQQAYEAYRHLLTLDVHAEEISHG